MAETEGTLSRKEMERAIEEGGSVLHEGKLLRTKKQLKQAFQTEEEIDQEIEDLGQRKEAVKTKAVAKKPAVKK